MGTTQWFWLDIVLIIRFQVELAIELAVELVERP